MFPRRFRFILLFTLLLMVGVFVSGCADQGGGVVIITATPDDIGGGDQSPTNTPIPNGGYDKSCNGLPGDGFVIENSNPCLIGHVKSQAEDGTVQCRPEQFVLYSKAANIDGYPDGYSAHAGILCSGIGFLFPVSGINGEWGFTTVPTTLDAGCHILKMTGTTNINDPDNPNDYMATLRRGSTRTLGL